MTESSLNDPCPVCGERPNAIKTDFVPGAITFYHRSGRTFWFCTMGPEGKTTTRDRPGDAANYAPKSGPAADWWAKVAADRPGSEQAPLTDEELAEFVRLNAYGLAHTDTTEGGKILNRLLAEVPRLRALIDRVAKHACEYDDPDDECCFCGGEDGEHPEPHHHADGCTLLDVYRETCCKHGMDRRAAVTNCRECREEAAKKR